MEVVILIPGPGVRNGSFDTFCMEIDAFCIEFIDILDEFIQILDDFIENIKDFLEIGDEFPVKSVKVLKTSGGTTGKSVKIPGTSGSTTGKSVKIPGKSGGTTGKSVKIRHGCMKVVMIFSHGGTETRRRWTSLGVFVPPWETKTRSDFVIHDLYGHVV